jgi:rare lipoprotein A
MNRRSLNVRVLAACAIVLIAACGKKNVRVAVPPSSRPPAVQVPAGTVERGIASWYGRPYHGRPAADGETYDMELLVAAHRTLPFQTRVSVRNLANGKTVEVRIIDRGPFVEGRIIDLSHKAAQEIEMIGSGTAQVEVTVLSAPATLAPALFGVQVGAFRDKANADRMARTMAAMYGAGRQAMRAGDPPLFRVLAGAESSSDAAEALARRIRTEQNVPQAFVVRLDP